MVERGGCHCGRVRFEVTFDSWEVLDCNCSMCTRKALLHLIVGKDAFRLLQGAEALHTYTFGTHTAKHTFCRFCGIHPFYTPRSHPDGVDVNARALDRFHELSFVVTPFDGANWEQSVEALRPVPVHEGLLEQGEQD